MKLPRRNFLRLAAGAAALPVLSPSAWAQGWPARNVRLVVPFAPGPGIDSIARIIANRLSELWKIQVIIENRAGSGGNLGSEAVAKSAPDGYTLLFHGPGMAVSRHLYERLSYDPITDFAPVILTTMFPNVMIVPNSSTPKSVKNFIDLARSRKRMTFASSGTGTTQHLSGELFKSLAGIELTHVPYRGAPPALTDLIAGRVDAAFFTSGAVSEVIASGQVRALAVTSAKRFALLPDVPSISEVLPSYDASSWFAFWAPAKTPSEIIAKINSDTRLVLADPSIKQRLAQLSVVIAPSSPDELSTLLKNEIDKWGKVIKEAGVKPE